MKRLALVIATIALTVGVICLAGRILGLDLGGRLSRFRSTLFPGQRGQLFEKHERLGWCPKPGARVTRHEPEYTATYTVGADGDRIVPGRPDSGTTVAFLGCSFCFGLGVNDDEVFSSVLQREYWKDCRVRNLGCIGYSTAHVLLRLEDEIKAGRKIDVAVYCWMWQHRSRNDRRRAWLKSLTAIEGKNPLYEVEEGRLVFKGLIGVEESLNDTHPLLARREDEITCALLKAIRALCQEHGIRLVVLLYPFPLGSGFPGFETSDKQMVSDCQSLGIDYLDLTGDSTLKDPAAFYPKDCHPKAPWHRTVARLVAEGLDPKTGRVRSHVPATQPAR
jgi:hypothetical protein